MRTLNIEHLKSLAHHVEFQELAARVIVAETVHQSLQEKMEPLYQIVFEQTGPFVIGPSMGKEHFPAGRRPGDRITEYKYLYLCQDEEKLKLFNEGHDTAVRMAGFDLPPGHCPVLVAGHILCEYQTRFLACTDKVMGTPFAEAYAEHRKKALELMMPVALQGRITEKLARTLLPKAQSDMNTYLAQLRKDTIAA